MELYKTLPVLTDEEIRVLGALIEKSKTTPEYYPMTLNSLTAACNQKSSRKPVVEYDEETVVIALNSLKAQSLVSTAVGGSSRTIKYKHNFATVYPLSEGELTILCLLFLRGPQTPGEINTNSGRLHEFSSIESVMETLNKMSIGEIPFVKELGKRPGQKEARYIHLLTDKLPDMNAEVSEEPARKSVNEMESRLMNVENELQELKQTLSELIKELKG
jgi:uncharacterized protein YceH (UPF0502 family)